MKIRSSHPQCGVEVGRLKFEIYYTTVGQEYVSYYSTSKKYNANVLSATTGGWRFKVAY